MPKISILVPIFNVEKYLRQCLDSVASQTLRDIEIICINDGSTDGSLAIIEDYVARDNRFYVINKPNSGYGDSMNQGLRLASGKYVGILESDDWADPRMFEDLFKLAEKHSAEVAKGEYFSYFSAPEKQALNSLKSNLILDQETDRPINPRYSTHIFYQQPSIWSAIYRRDFLNDNGIEFLDTPGASYQDTAFNFKVWTASTRVVFTKNAYLHYRLDSEGSSVNSPNKVFCVSDEYQEIERYLQSRGEPEDLFRLMRACKWGGYRWNIERLNPELAREFIAHASEEYLRDYRSGDFSYQYCDVNFVRGIEEIMFHPERTIARKEAQDRAKISIVFPVYNVEKYVRGSLESLLSQTFSEIEIIVVDDGSQDNSIGIVAEYLSEDPRITLIHQENKGLSAARNVGVQAAHGDYLAFLDSDDRFDPDALERLYEAMTVHRVELVCASSRVEFEIGNRTAAERLSDQQYVKNMFVGEHPITGDLLSWTDVHVWNKLFVTKVVRNNHILFPEGLKYEDAYFFNVYAWSAQKCYFLGPERPIHTYVRRPGAIMTDTFYGNISARDHLTVATLLFEEVQHNGRLDDFGAYYLLLLDRYVHFALIHSSEEELESIWRTVRTWVADNSEALRRMDPLRYEDFESRVFPVSLLRLGKYPSAQRFVLKSGMRIRDFTKKLRRQ